MYELKKDERYINMCKCPEVQKYRKVSFREGDILANYREVWVNTDADTRKRAKVLDEILLFTVGLPIAVKDLVVWLPRQSDIQDMLGYDFPFMARQFSAYVEDNVEPEKFGLVLKTQFTSMHEFWLAFYMLETYKKVWNWGQWKNIKIWDATKKKWVDVEPGKKK